MNWLAFDLRAYGGAALGCVFAILAATALDAPRDALPCLVGLGAGLGCAALAVDRSGLRGLVVAALGTWVSVLFEGARSQSDLGATLALFHLSLTFERLLWHVFGFGLAAALARTSFRARAGRRPIGV